MVTWEFHEDWGDGADENDPLHILLDLEAVAKRLYDTVRPTVDEHKFVDAFLKKDIPS